MNKKEELNDFLVHVFNDILRLEEQYLYSKKGCNLSVSEMHLLEILSELEENQRTMSNIAKEIGITASSLTTAVKTLEAKGYIVRVKNQIDKRIVYCELTDKAQTILSNHKEFHDEMCESVMTNLDENQTDILCSALNSLHTFFKKDK